MKKIALLYFLFLFFFSSIFSSGIIDSQDGFQYLAVARDIYYLHKPTAPVYEYTTRKNIHMSTFVAADGNTYSPTGLGYSLALVPAVAITDLFYKIYHVSPPVHFPLESDWLIFLLASFTNNIFFALLGVIMLFYFISLKLSTKLSLALSLVTLFTTNLWVYSKDAFAHMMFIVFLTLSFYLVKKYFVSRDLKFLLFSGMAFGIVSFTYNQSYLISIPAFVIYYLLLLRSSKIGSLNLIAQNFSIFMAGFIPLFLISVWYDAIRAGASSNLNSVTTYASYAKGMFKVPVGVFFEGIYGQLLSPGRGVFLYSPILLILIIFWHKIRSIVKPELVSLLVLSFFYITFYATQYSVGSPTQGIASLWDGESSWGPRYLTLLIPFAMLVIGYIFTQLGKRARLLIFYPLLALGLYINFLGIIMPYQIKFNDLQDHFFVNSTEYTSYLYSNLLPRYSPVLLMSKNLIKLAQSFPKTLNHGAYNVRLYDGIDFPFNVGPERWRVIDGTGYISFDNNTKDPVKVVSFGLINHPLEDDASSSAQVSFTLNNHLLGDPVILALRERKLVEIPIERDYLKQKDNQLVIDVANKSPFSSDQKNFTVPSNRNLSLLEPSKQILSILSLSINDHPVNMESLDFPYISPLGPAMTGVRYQNYGGLNQDPWKSWDIHTQIYERVPDFWWIKPLYYWDLPTRTILIFFTVDLATSIYLAFVLKKLVLNKHA